MNGIMPMESHEDPALQAPAEPAPDAAAADAAEMRWYGAAAAAGAAAGGEPAAESTGGGGNLDEGGVAEGRRLRSRRGPRQPTQAERERHDRDHWPFEAWCRFCVGSRSVAAAHPNSQQQRSQPIVSVDYFYPGASPADDQLIADRRKERAERGEADEEEEVPTGAMTALAVHDSASSAIYAFAVSRKGVCADAVTKVTDILEYLGYNRITLKSDQEPSMMALTRAVAARRSGECVPEESLAYTPQANEIQGSLAAL